MSIGAISNSPVPAQKPASVSSEQNESKVSPEHDGDGDDAAASVSKASAPSVNSSGSVVGSVVNVKV